MTTQNHKDLRESINKYSIPYNRFFSLVKYFVSQILAGSNFRHRTSVRKLNSDKNLILSKIIFGLNTCNISTL